MTSRADRIRFITHAALYLALSVLLPIGFHAFGMGGRVFLPMHIPVLLAGFLMGPVGGVVVGLLAPLLSYLTTGMPPTYAVPLMSMELPMYGLVAGIAYRKLHLNVYIALVAAMLVGRLMFGLGLFALGLFMDLPYTASAFFASGGALWSGLPGIAVQLALIPIVVAALNRKVGFEIEAKNKSAVG
ncbi:MAG: ECF transporter S component [Candidatus Zixiibacteriota bacterium]